MSSLSLSQITSGATLKFAKVARSLIDVAAVVFALLFVSVTGIGLAFAVFCLLFVSL